MYFCSFEKEATIFAEYIGFGDVVKSTREFLVLNPCISYASMRSHGFIDGENYTHRKVCQLHCGQR